MKILDVFCPFLKIKSYIINLAYNTLNNCLCLPSLLQHQSISNLQVLNHHIGFLSILPMEGVFFPSGILSSHFFLPCSTCIIIPAPICHYYFKVNTYALSSQNNSSSGNVSLTFRSLLNTVS